MSRTSASDSAVTRARALGTVALLCLCAGWGFLEVADEDVERGNQAYAEERFDQALGAYRKARARAGRDTAGEARALYNMGAALYRTIERSDAASASTDEPGTFARYGAIESFRTAATLGMRHQDFELASSAYLGLGNALFSAGDVRGAIAAYKDALRANPDNDDARYNLELSWRQLQRDSGDRPGSRQPRRHPPGGQGNGQSGKSPGSQEQGQGQRPDRGDKHQGESRDQAGSGSRSDGDRERPDDAAEQRRQPGGNGQADGDTEDSASAQDSPDGQDGASDRQPAGQPTRQPGRSGDRGATDRPGSADETPADDDRSGADPGDTSARAGESQKRTGAPSPDVGDKLDALERMSRDLQRDKLRTRARQSRTGRPQRDW